MAFRVRMGSFLEYLRDRSEETARVPAAEPTGIVILSGQLLRRNLKHHLNREDIPTAALAEFTTIEELASDLLEPTDDPTSILSDGVRDRLIEEIFRTLDPNTAETPLKRTDILKSSEERALIDLAQRLPYEEESTRETFLAELDDYFRWTDANTDVAVATRELAEVENRFAQLQTNRSVNAFRGVERLFQEYLDAKSLPHQQSRSHLISTARDHFNEQWNHGFDHLDWVAVVGINVFDNPTLRFLEKIADSELAPDVEIFAGVGSEEYNTARLEAVDTEVITESAGDTLPEFRSDAATELLQATQDLPAEVPNQVTFAEAPTDQRAIEKIAAEVRELVQNGTHPRNILIVAPDAGSYQSLIEQAFETVDVPTHVETRRPYANIPVYRCFRTFVDVVDAVSRDVPLTYDDLVDPIRLGYTPRGSRGRSWPIKDRAFIKVEQELHRKQQFYNRDPNRYEDQGLVFSTWRDQISDIPRWTGPWHAVEDYLDDIEALAQDPPKSGKALVDLFGSYLGTYVYQTVDHERTLYKGPAIDTTRISLTETHPTSQAEQVRNALQDVGTHYDRIRHLFDAPVSWREVGRAFSATLGGQSYGKSHLDQYAVPVVDAGNTYFRSADHLFILGMDAGEFPSDPGTPTFLHNDVRKHTYERALEGKYPYHHLDSRASNYNEALDFYQAALSTAIASAEITLMHTYKDDRSNEVAWSPFVDLFDLDPEDEAEQPVSRVSVGDWIPSQDPEEGSWAELAERIAPRERLRTVLYNAHRNTPNTEPAITAADIQSMLDQLEIEPLIDLILPRIDRHRQPPIEVEIEASEPAFAETDLATVSGEPHHPHELDLQAQCELKYYYYQFLYNFTGGDPPREEIPKYYSANSHYRLGKLPYMVRENYADPRYVDKWEAIVTRVLPDRQSAATGLAQFDTNEELREWVEQEDRFDSYDFNTIYANLRGERRLVEAEQAAGITRTWDWRSGGVVTINGYQLAVPPYRLDTVIEGGSEYTIPIFFTRFSNRAESALKSCFQGSIWEADERTGELCLDCGRSEDCTYHSKYVIDHRMLAAQSLESGEFDNKVVGIGMQEQYADPTNGKRIIAIQNNYTQKVQASENSFEQLVGRGYPQNWEQNVSDWEVNFTELAATLDTANTVTLQANPTVVNQDACLSCVYKDLCMIPNSEVNL